MGSQIKNTDPLPDDKYAVVTREDVVMVLAEVYTLEIAIIPKQKTLLVYAETIIIPADISLVQEDGNGKNLGLFCNRLLLTQPAARLRVSGKTGTNATANTETPNKGQNSGWLKLCIEDINDATFPRTTNDGKEKGLFLEACGGDGGSGADSTKPGADSKPANGGIGGAGGNGGAVEVYFGSSAVRQLRELSLATVQTKSWAEKVTGTMGIKLDGLIPATDINAFERARAPYQSLGHSLALLREDVKQLLERLDTLTGDEGVSEARSTANDLQRAIEEFCKSTIPPQTSSTQQAMVDNMRAQLKRIDLDNYPDSETWSLGSINMQALRKVLVTQETGQKADDEVSFEAQLENIKEWMKGRVLEQKNCWSAQILTTKGSGGRGGRGSSADAKWGAPGDSGLAGCVAGLFALDFSGRDSDLEIPTVIAQPDQCQMLLNRADLAYMTATLGSRVDMTLLTHATGYYVMLKKRLCFVNAAFADAIHKSQDHGNPSMIRPLAKAYADMESQQRLTISALSQLQFIKSRAICSLNRIEQHQDLFGLSSNWVPRLSCTYYYGKVQSSIETFGEFEKAFADMSSQPAFVNRKAIEAAAAMVKSIDIRIKMLTDSNGPLSLSAFQIEAFTPVMRQKLKKVREVVSFIRQSIKNKINLDPDMILEAFNMVALAPTKFNTALQLGTAGYKMATTVTSVEGVAVKSDYVIQQLGSCDGKLESLAEGYTNAKNGAVVLQDPGTAALLVSRSDLDSLIQKYSSAIPEGHIAAFKIAFEEYMSLIRKRNDAVITYNTTLQLLAEAHEDKKHYTAQQRTWSDDASKVDPNLPSRVFWIKKALNDLRYEVFQTLSYAERSLRFWGLPKDGDISFPLDTEFAPTKQLLSKYKLDIEKAFEKCLERYASNFENQWPPQKDRQASGNFAKGIMYILSDSELSTLKQANPFGGDGKNVVYQVVFPIKPVVSKTSDIESSFYAMANVRIDQIRIWLPGAIVSPTGSQQLTIGIDQLGTESIVRGTDDKIFDFVHDPINLAFRYNPANIDTLDDIPKAKIFQEQLIPGCFKGTPDKINDNVFASIGPFAEWRITLNSRYNQGLSLKGLRTAAIEFWGSNDNFPNLK